MKKKFFSTLLLGSLIALFGTNAQASTAAANQQADTDLTFSLNDGGHNVNPGVYKGKLVLVYTPAKYDLGNKAVGDAQTLVNTSTAKRYVGVIDDREDAERGGWNLTAQLDKFSTGTNQLDATVNFDLGKASGFSYTDNETKSDYIMPSTPAPLADGVYQAAGGTGVAASDFTVTPNIAIATDNTAVKVLGTTTATVGKSTLLSEVTGLQIVLGATDQNDVGTYSSKLHWTLTNGL